MNSAYRKRDAETTVVRCGLLGPGRSRNGLGPFLARWLERAGLRVAAAAGRDLERTRAAVAGFAAELDHPVEVRDGLAGLLEAGDLDVLVVAAPVDAHLAALRAACAAGVHVLCEKPLVPARDAALVPELCEAFVAQDRMLVENCQWACVLDDFDRLWPERRAAPPRRLDMRLSPSGRGLAMLTDSLSHYISLLQATAPVDSGTRLVRCALSSRDPKAESLTVELAFAEPFPEVAGVLHLVHQRLQPREAWFEIDGLRLERRIRTEDYTMVAHGGGRQIVMDDPLGRLVYRFADAVRTPTAAGIRAEAHRIRERARLFHDVIAAW